MDKNNLSDVFEMLITRLTNLEQITTTLLECEKYKNDMAPAGAIISGLVHCGHPIQVTKNFDGYTYAKPYIVVQGIEHLNYELQLFPDDPKDDPVHIHNDLKRILGKDEFLRLYEFSRNNLNRGITCKELNITSHRDMLNDHLIDRYLEYKIPALIAYNGEELLFQFPDEKLTLSTILDTICSLCKLVHIALPDDVTIHRIEPRYEYLVKAIVLRDNEQFEKAWALLPRCWQRKVVRIVETYDPLTYFREEHFQYFDYYDNGFIEFNLN